MHGEEATDLTVRLSHVHLLIAQDHVGDEVEISSSVWMFGRNVIVALEAMNSRAIGSASSTSAG
jgi:hypothetical protein